MRKKRLTNRAFTLTELLVVVIIVGTLAAVAAPKFSRVLETRRTTEAEEMLSAVRTEQEHRCAMGKNYLKNAASLEMLASGKNSKNYSYSLSNTGVTATSLGKDYSIQMPAYRTGLLCCEGEYCSNLNKSYPTCAASMGDDTDACSAANIPADPSDPVQPSDPDDDLDPCTKTPNTCACSTYAAAHPCECDADYATANPCTCQGENTQVCCESKGMTWDAATKSCTSGTSDEPACSGTKKYIGQVRFATFDEARALDTCNGDIGFANSAGSGQFNAKNVTEELCNKGSCIDLMMLSCSQTGSSASSEKKKVQKGSAQMSHGSSGTPQGSTCNSRLVAAVADRINNPVKDSSGMGNRILSWQEACPLYCSGMAPVISSTPCSGSCYAEFTHQHAESGTTVTAVEWQYVLSCEIGYEEPSDEDTGSSCLFNKYQWTFTKN